MFARVPHEDPNIRFKAVLARRTTALNVFQQAHSDLKQSIEQLNDEHRACLARIKQESEAAAFLLAEHDKAHGTAKKLGELLGVP